MNYIRKELWETKDDMELEPVAEEAIRCNKNAYVLAGPGAGKTELLAQKACYLLETNTCLFPKKVLAISFKRDAAKNLKRRVRERCGKEYTNRFVSLTFHSFAKRLLDQFRTAIPKPYRPSSDYDIVSFYAKDVAGLRKEVGEPELYSGYFDYKDFANEYADEKLPLKEENIDSNEEWYKYQLWETYINNIEKSKLTFKMIIRIVEYLIRSNPKLLHALRNTYSHVFLDEFQDTTSLQYDLVKTLFKDSNVVLTAVGGIKQKIMGWAGAKSQIFTYFRKDFKAEKFEMIINHRSAPRLVNIQTSIINDMLGSAIEIEHSDKWKNEEQGFCEIWHFENEFKEAETLALQIKKWIENEQVEKRDIGILVRQKADVYCEELTKSLNDLGIHARVEDKWQDLLAENFMPYILDIFKLATAKRDAEAWSNIISNIQALQGEEENETYNIEIELNEFLRSFRKKLNKKAVYKIKNVEDLLWEIINFIGTDLIKNRYSEYSKGLYFEQKMKQTADFLCDSINNKSGDWTKALEDFLGAHSIPIMTIHKSKGLEFNTVILLGLEDGAFWNYKDNMEEETFTFFVGLSRAKNKLIFTYSPGRLFVQERHNIYNLYQMLWNAGVEEIEW